MTPEDLDIQKRLMQEKLNLIKNPVRKPELPPIILKLADDPAEA